MNNGYPPYQDRPQWGQQPPAGQYPAQQGSYQQPQAGPSGYQQPYEQNPYGQQGYQQPYQQPAYQQPQTYQQQPHQAQESYAQQNWQPYQQNPYSQQSYQQPYGQNAYGGMYQQGMQNAQPLQQGYPQQNMQEPAPGVFYPAQGYSGYVSQTKAQQPSPFSGEVIVKVVLFGVLPVLFILGLVLKAPVLCWLFIAAAVAAVAAMWLKPLVGSSLRLAASLICGVLAVVALVTALNGVPGKEQSDQQNIQPGANAGVNSNMNVGTVQQATDTPTPTPTVTPDPYAEAGAAEQQLQSFFYFWHVNNDENMLALTAPSWRNSVSDPKEELFRIRMNRIPLDDAVIVNIGGSEADSMRTAKVKVTINKNNNREPERYSFNVIVLKEDGVWYIDPRSLESNEKAVETTPATNPMPTQPVLNTGAPDLVLYFNPDGGEKYHIDPNCDSVHTRWKPLQGQFLFSQLNTPPYDEFEQCSVCGAPLRVK